MWGAVEVTVACDDADLVVSIRAGGRALSMEDLGGRQERGQVGLRVLERTALDGGGTVRVDSSLGHGTMVELRAPPPPAGAEADWRGAGPGQGWRLGCARERCVRLESGRPCGPGRYR
jgi:hypothetical protein